MANKIKIKEVSKAAKKSSLPLNPSPYAYGSIPDNDILHVKGHSNGKFAVKWLKKVNRMLKSPQRTAHFM